MNFSLIATALAETAATTDATAATATTDAASSSTSLMATLVSLVPMILIFVVFYFVLIRPQRKKDKEVQDMLKALKVSDRICTIGGIYGTITGIKDDTITLAVGRNNMEMVVARWAIRSVEDVKVENDSEELN